MSAACPNCGEANATIREPFAENVTCQKCDALWRTPEVAAIRYADPQNRLDFEDWRQLLEALSPAILNREVLSHVGLVLAADGRRLLDEHDADVSMQDAHISVQENARAQNQLYQLAMNLWR
jgi:hypothetical protein